MWLEACPLKLELYRKVKHAKLGTFDHPNPSSNSLKSHEKGQSNNQDKNGDGSNNGNNHGNNSGGSSSNKNKNQKAEGVFIQVKQTVIALMFARFNDQNMA
jgi:hypothetical protein